jgi:hypothetical protein
VGRKMSRNPNPQNNQNQEFSTKLILRKVQEFIKNLGAECHENKFFEDDVYDLSGFLYTCDYKNKWFDIIVDPSKGVYIKAPFNFSKAEQIVSKLSETFEINLNKLRFSMIGFYGVFKLESLPDEVINLTTDADEIDLSTKNSKILIDIRDKISILYNKETKKFNVLSIKDWETYRKIRSYIDQDIREILDKLSLSKLEFIVKYDENEEIWLEGKRKEIMLKLLSKLVPTINKINNIEIRINEYENEVILNDIVLELKDENWEFDMPVDVIKKLLSLNDTVVIKLYKDFWFIEVHNDYLLKVASILGIDPMQTVHAINPRKESLLFYEPRDYYIFTGDYSGDYYHIVPSRNVRKYLQLLLGVDIRQQGTSNSFEINDGDHKYVIIKGHEDEIHVGVYKENNLLTSLRTYLWYFGVKSFNELKNLSKEKIIDLINRQINERYFYPMPFAQLKQYVLTLINNTIIFIDEAINSIQTRTPDFPSMVKDIDEINCIFDDNCQVTLELDEVDRLSSYYSLIGTSKGHLPVPSFLEYVTIEGKSDEEDISIVKNVLYFIRGYDKKIPESERDYSSDDNVRGAESELFQKAVVLYNKWLNENKLHHTEDDEEYDDEEECECPEHTLPDGMGYCRDFDYRSLIKKSENELVNDIVESLIRIKEKIVNIREKMLKFDLS